MNDSPFHYSTGEVVCIGDRVISANRYYGVVESITLPGTEDAEDHYAPEGGVTIAQNCGGIVGYYFLTPTAEMGCADWDVTVFLHRGSVILPPFGTGSWPWPYEQGPFAGGLNPDA